MAEIAAGAARGKRLEIWLQDEARIGQKNKITRRWAKRGTRPTAPHDQRTRSAYIFGAICPKLGKAAALVMPWCDTHAMTQHLSEISRHLADDAHAILIMDQAGWHTSNNLVVPGNITILPLPPKSPELNPVKTSGSSCARTGVQSLELMDWIEPESFWLLCPDGADIFIRSEASKGLEAAAGELYAAMKSPICRRS